MHTRSGTLARIRVHHRLTTAPARGSPTSFTLSERDAPLLREATDHLSLVKYEGGTSPKLHQGRRGLSTETWQLPPVPTLVSPFA